MNNERRRPIDSIARWWCGVYRRGCAPSCIYIDDRATLHYIGPGIAFFLLSIPPLLAGYIDFSKARAESRHRCDDPRRRRGRG